MNIQYSMRKIMSQSKAIQLSPPIPQISYVKLFEKQVENQGIYVNSTVQKYDYSMSESQYIYIYVY